MKHKLALFFFICVIGHYGYSQEVPTSVFANNQGERKWMIYQDNFRALYRVLYNEAAEQLDKRSAYVSSIQTKAGWVAYQQGLKQKYKASLIKFKKTALNTRITGRLEREKFTVEKIIFESHPGFYVTGCLFIPKERQTPAPAIIYCSGHSENGFRSEAYQRSLINFVEKGFVVFAFDPIGQGERLQYLDETTGKSKIGGPTAEHSYAGIQTLLTGTSISDYFIWDGVRAVDFLATRKEVDMKRIGITGRSGGGTQTALIAAYDDRIQAAAPECYITTFKRLLQSIGPQDAEQNPYASIKKGIDIPDLIHMRAPKPTLIVTTTHDFFSQQGARETFEEAKKSYNALGAAENIQFAEDMGKHQSTKKNREAVNAFFMKFLNLPGDPTDREVNLFREEELWVTPTGQVAGSLKGSTVFELNRRYHSVKNSPPSSVKDKIKETAGIHFERKLTAAVFTGKFSTGAVEIEKYFLENNKNDYALPVYVIKKTGQEEKNVVVWNHPSGKEKLLEEPLLMNVLNAGNVVVSADLPGIGELHDSDFRGDGFVRGVPFNYTFIANLVGKSISGVQAEALDLLMQFIESTNRYRGATVSALAEGTLVPAVLSCAIFNNGFRKIAVLDPPPPGSYFLETEYYDPFLAFSVVPGSIGLYEWKDLLAFSPQTPVKIFEVKNKPQSDNITQPEIVDFLRK
ncbi:MAG TPA: xylan esterase [Porphyromonadaceae bacterium]|jgi:cephalosporin-C deacetylase-like acetyl esterase|nr:xylan esterase [Porphyromonadaceae bacterium]